MKNRSNQQKLRQNSQRAKQAKKYPRHSSRRQYPEKLYLYGIHTIGEALANSARVKHRLLITLNAAKRLENQIAKFGDRLDILNASPQELDALVGRDAVHQGVVLECDPLRTKSLDDLEPGAALLILDQVSDPHNVGAIMRSCVAMGIGALITTNRNSAPQTAVLAKSASGAMDLIDLIEVSNLSKVIQTLNLQGYQTIGLDSQGSDILQNSIDYHCPIALVLGAEGSGLRKKTRETCSILARLDMPGKIKSLNVSNAAILALYIASQRPPFSP